MGKEGALTVLDYQVADEGHEICRIWWEVLKLKRPDWSHWPGRPFVLQSTQQQRSALNTGNCWTNRNVPLSLSWAAFPIPRLDEISHVREEEPLVPDIPEPQEPQEPEILSFTYTGEERQKASSPAGLALPLPSGVPLSLVLLTCWPLPLSLSECQILLSSSSSFPSRHSCEGYVM